jgi:hypothetical protein
MKRLILLVALVMAMAVLAPSAFADDDTDEVAGADVETEEKELSEAQQLKAKLIADYFAVNQGAGATDEEIDSVEAIRTGWSESPQYSIGHTVGWGVVYQLKLFGFEPGDYEGGWAIGQLRKTYLEDNDLDRKDLHKHNFGQLQKEEKSAKPDKTMPTQAKKDKTDD